MEYYDVLANTVGGGKPKMRYHFDNNGWPAFFGGSQVPASEEQKSAMVDALQDQKTEFYKEIVEESAAKKKTDETAEEWMPYFKSFVWEEGSVNPTEEVREIWRVEGRRR